MASSTAYPGTLANDSSSGTVTWVNASNASADDGSVATSTYNTNNTTGTSYYLKVTNFGFDIPDGATIDGIVVEIERHWSSGGPGSDSNVVDQYVKVVKSDGALGTENKGSATFWPLNSPSTATYGSASDLWSETWTAEDINDADFGVALTVALSMLSGDGPVVANVDFIRITVHYTPIDPSRSYGFKVSKPGFDVLTAEPFELAATSAKLSEAISNVVVFTHAHTATTQKTSTFALNGFTWTPQFLIYNVGRGAFLPTYYGDISAATFENWEPFITQTSFSLRSTTTNSETFSHTIILYLLYNSIT